MFHPSLLGSQLQASTAWRTRHITEPSEPGADYLRHDTRELQFRFLVTAFERCGGIATGDKVAAMMRTRSDQAVSLVARWIVSRSVVCFSWRTQAYVPLFQFEQASMSLLPELKPVINELVGPLDEWDLALWFAEPNAWLHGLPPVSEIAKDPVAVLSAAQADRFIAHG